MVMRDEKRYHKDHNLETKALLLIHNAPPDHKNLGTFQICILVEVVFLKLNTTSVIQPLDQNLISNMKAYYFHRSIEQLVEETEGQDKQSF
ncbi:transposable element-derived 1 [Octopus vulgaris]|uniref:Transposable element-derived 1 n=1 Tax=Octopus vulgaris TaxID=6645 RepID=A0AA36BLD1_OCTVU|nr:transposable element-derived 1 [Octopus vulgaris]